MRMIPALLLLAAGCGNVDRDFSQQVNTLHIGAVGLDVSISNDGRGRFSNGRFAQPPTSGTFAISPQQYSNLLKQLSEFREESAPADESSRSYLNTSCPRGLPYLTDAGMISIRWKGVGFDQIYIADFGCDYERNAARNTKLRTILKGLPVPEPMPLG
jgi:hypothetical protein